MTITDAANALREGRFREAEELAISWIGTYKHDAQAWVYLGEALLRQGNGLMANRVFRRAHMLDPEAAWVHSVNAELAKANGGRVRSDIEALLEVKKVTVAAALLVRNEIRCIERCLRSLQHAVDEIVVVDCQSTDGTAEFVRAFPNTKVVSFEWCDDFAAARNAGLPLIESDWVIWVDADETLIPEDVANIRKVAGLYDDSPVPVVVICGILELMGNKQAVNYAKGRMHSMKRGLQFWGRVHEQIGAEKGIYETQLLGKTALIRFHHDGYSPEVMQDKKKLERNLRLLAMMREEDPGNPAWWLYSGRETLGTGDVEQALVFLRKADEMAAVQPKFARRLEILMLLVSVYMARKQWDEAEACCMEAQRVDPGFPDTMYHMALIQMQKAQELFRAAERNLHASKQAGAAYRGVVSADINIPQWRADLSLADMARRFGRFPEAKAMYEQIAKRMPGDTTGGMLVRKRLEKMEAPATERKTEA
ncbi:MAG: glycosyltransferase [Paenibacillaceae bacterium]|nr:glycosyltransferase [Paenibacillaceae bacterium]